MNFWRNHVTHIRLSLKKMRLRAWRRSGYFLLTPVSCHWMTSLRRMKRSTISDWLAYGRLLSCGGRYSPHAKKQRNIQELEIGTCQHTACGKLSTEARDKFWSGVSRYWVGNITTYCLLVSIFTHIIFSALCYFRGCMDRLCPFNFTCWIPSLQ